MIRQLNEATAALKCAEQPLGRIAGLAAKARMAAKRPFMPRSSGYAKPVAAIDDWLYGGLKGSRPEPNPATLEAERRYAEVAADVDRERVQLPARVTSATEGAERVRTLTAELDAAFSAVAPPSTTASARIHPLCKPCGERSQQQ